MPYIKQEDRGRFDPHIVALLAALTRDGTNSPKSGEVNYVISKLIWELFESAPSYNEGNSLMGALECAKLEFYRRKMAPYEDKKILENGDVCES